MHSSNQKQQAGPRPHSPAGAKIGLRGCHVMVIMSCHVMYPVVVFKDIWTFSGAVPPRRGWEAALFPSLHLWPGLNSSAGGKDIIMSYNICHVKCHINCVASFCITQITFKLISRYQITKIFSQVALKIFSKYSPRLPSSPPQPIPAKGAHQLYPRVPGRKKVSVRIL